MDKGPGDIKYPTGKTRQLKKMPDGKDNPQDRTFEAIDGAIDDEVVGQPHKFSYTPEMPSNIGDDGQG